MVTPALPWQDAAALLSGCAAAICLMSSPMFRTRRMILLAQLGAGICFATHYAFLGIAVASAANILGTVQTVAALLAARSASMERLGYALICLMVLSGLWFWQGPISALSVIALTLIALGRMQSNELHLRLLLLAGGCFWMAHDYLGEAWIALVADVGTALVGAAALFSLLFRVRIEWRLPGASGPVAA